MGNLQDSISTLATTHRIETAVLDISFEQPQMAEQFQQDAHHYVLHRLLPAIDRVFDEHQQKGWEISIDSLVIDLGELDHRDYLGQLESRLVSALSEKMMDLSVGHSAGRTATLGELHSNGVIKEVSFRQLSTEEREWQQLCYFLNRGQLPWSSPFAAEHLASKQWQDWLTQTLFRNIKPLVLLLNRSPYLDSLLCRLVLQLPNEKCIELLLNVAQPSRVAQVKYLLKLMLGVGDELGISALEKRFYVNGALLNSATNTEKLFFIRSLLKATLTGSTRQSADAIEPINEWFPALMDIGQRYLPDELKPEFSALFSHDNHQKEQGNAHRNLLVTALFIKAITSGNVNQFQSVWHLALGEYRAEFLKLVIHFGQRAEIRYRLSLVLTDDMWLELLTLIEPSESDFIRQISQLFVPVKQSDLDVAASTDGDISQSQSKEQFWLFTLTYLLVERGSQFNRKSYLQSMLSQHASHHNTSQIALNQWLLQSLESLPMASALKRNMQALLTQLQGELTGKQLDKQTGLNSVAQTGLLTAEQVVLEDIALALHLGRYERLKLHWRHYVSAFPDALISSLYLYGHNAICVTKLVTNLSLPMRRDTLGLLAPKERWFIQPLIEQTPTQLAKVEMDKSVAQRELSHQLWEFTFSYLLVERGSNFNNLSYLGYVTRKIAAHNNLDHQGFVRHLATAFYSLDTHSEMQTQLLQLLAELLLAPIVLPEKAETAPFTDLTRSMPTVDKTRQAYRQFILALAVGDAENIEKIIGRLGLNDRAAVMSILDYFMERSCSQASARHTITQPHKNIELYLLSLPPSTLTLLLKWLYPNTEQWLDALINPASVLCVDVRLAPQLDEKVIANNFTRDGNEHLEVMTTSVSVSAISLRRKMRFSNQLSQRIWREIWLSVKEEVGDSELTALSEQLIMRVFGRVAEFRHCSLDALLQAIALDYQRHNDSGYLAELVNRQLKNRIDAGEVKMSTLQNPPAEVRRSSIEAGSHLKVDDSNTELRLKQMEQYQRSTLNLTTTCKYLFFAVNHCRQSSDVAMKDSVKQIAYWLAEIFKLEPISALSDLKRAVFRSFVWRHIWQTLSPVMFDELVNSIKSMVPAAVFNTLMEEWGLRHGIAAGFSQHYRSTYRLRDSLGDLQPITLTVRDLFGASMRGGKKRGGASFKAENVVTNSNSEKGGEQPSQSALRRSATVTKEIQSTAILSMIETQSIEVLDAELASIFVMLSESNSHHTSASLQPRFNRCVKALLIADAARLKICLLNALPSKEVANMLFKHRSENECHELLTLLFSTHYQHFMRVVDLFAIASNSIRSTRVEPLSLYLFAIEYLQSNSRSDLGDIAEGYLTMLYEVAGSFSGRFSTRALFVSQIVKELKSSSNINISPVYVQSLIEAIEAKRINNNSLTALSSSASSHEANSQTSSDKTLKALSLAELEQLIYGLPANISSEHLEQDGDKLHIPNAGVVLATPYISRLFSLLKLTESGRFVDEESQERGALLLQYLVTGQSEAGEHLLTFNKLLCGMKIAKPLRFSITLTDKEKETADGLLVGIIDNWKTVGQTSPEGLRETFLQREGVLNRDKDIWKLQVQTKAFDVLLDSLPWSFSVIKFPWMERVLHVEWR